MIGTAIEWATDTVNFWWGCTKVSEACRFCYAERVDGRLGPHLSGVAGEYHWGPGAPRLLQVEKALQELGKIRRRAARTGERPRVFINSMSDFFEDRRDLDDVRLLALNAMRVTPEVDYLLLTKRPGTILRLLHDGFSDTSSSNALSDWLVDWVSGHAPRNIWLGTTVENQEAADRRIPELLKIPAAVRFLSCEPLLGAVDLVPWLFVPDPMGAPTDLIPRNRRTFDPSLDWVICGGESGAHARPMHPDWARGLRDQCAAAGVPFFFKQWGEWADFTDCPPPSGREERIITPSGEVIGASDGKRGTVDALWQHCGGAWMARVGKKAAGRLLDGQEHNAFPEVR